MRRFRFAAYGEAGEFRLEKYRGIDGERANFSKEGMAEHF